MEPVAIEYWGGPADGRRDLVLPDRHGCPPRWRSLEFQPPRSGLDPEPAPPEEHRYVRETPRPGQPWRYRWNGR